MIFAQMDEKNFVDYGKSYEIVSLTDDADQWALTKLWFKEN